VEGCRVTWLLDESMLGNVQNVGPKRVEPGGQRGIVKREEGDGEKEFVLLLGRRTFLGLDAASV